MIAFGILVLAFSIPNAFALSNDSESCEQDCWKNRMPGGYFCNQIFMYSACDNKTLWDPLKGCIESCPANSTAQEEYLNKTKLLEQSCDKKNFQSRLKSYKDHIPCVNGTCAEVDGNCSYNCNGTRLKELLQDILTNPDSTDHYINHTFGEVCRGIKCYKNCSATELTQKCGSGSDDVLRYTGYGIGDILHEKQIPKEKWPKDCLEFWNAGIKTGISVITVLFALVSSYFFSFQ